MKTLLWIIFVIVVSILSFQDHTLIKNSNYGIVHLELANTELGVQILKEWHQCHYGELTLLDVARNHTRLDFLFIFTYVSLIISMSNWQMQREQRMLFNELLRFNLFITVLAGLLDFIENFRILHNFQHIGAESEYWATNWLSSVKFGLIGFAILVFLISLLTMRRKVQARKPL
ncbi:hypothetical protein [Pedobacter foliorum]|uniref:hypothetical protein n=1 Tax=Pedobacter foliorum TaxID=2739058 RepID=UPI001566C6BE|nr:hypothetical protein [Pedobacter foliorum]NRF37146.1 hypothetical protein [Pedobacter foliorum]